MYDTISVKIFMTIPEKELEGWLRIEMKSSSSRRVMFKTNINKMKPSCITLAYYPQPIQGDPFVLVEFSAPKITFGRNTEMVYDIQPVINAVNEHLRFFPFFENVDVGDGTIFRLDVCFNHYTGEETPYYFVAFAKLNFPHRETIIYKGGVYFKSKNTTTKFYSLEMSIGAAGTGIMRQETTIRSAHNIAKKIKLPGRQICGSDFKIVYSTPKLKDLTPSIAKRLLEDDLSRLKLLNGEIGTWDTTLTKLINEFGNSIGLRYYGFLRAINELGDKDLLATLLMKDVRTIERDIVIIYNAGISIFTTDNIRPLPILRIE